MKSLRKFAREKKFRTNVLIGALLFMAVAFAGIGIQSNKAFNSVEVKFTDASHSGLAIVPASCPSNPGDADAPYGCSAIFFPACQDGSIAPNGVVGQCSCAQGNSAACARCPNGALAPGNNAASCSCAQGNVNACARCADGSLAPGNNPAQCSCAQGNQTMCARCPDGSLAPNNDAAQCGCLQGNVAICGTHCPDGSAAPSGNATQCTCAQGNANACTGGGSCPIGYRLNSAGVCIFSGCPSGYMVQGNACVLSGCGANQHAVGSLCVCNSTNLLPDANGNCTAQVCPSGFQYDPGTGKCIAINQCVLPGICSDQTHALNQCTGAITNCALNGAGWICFNGACIKSPAPIASIIAGPSLVSPGYSVKVSWTSQNTASCRVTGNNGDGVWTGTSGSQDSKVIQSQTIYTLVCDGFDGSTITKSATVNIIPVEIEN